MKTSALQQAIDKAGNQTKLAKLLTAAAREQKGLRVRRRKFSPQNISFWVKRSAGIVPADVAPLIELATGVPKHALRPDVFERAA